MTAKRTPRRFEHVRGARHAQRAFISLSGASGGGKTKSALELAQGLVSITGGKIFGVDTENGRMLKYAPAPGVAASPMDAPAEGKTYDFEHLDFQPPFDPDSYLDALRHCEANGAGAIIFDSMSHEHAGEGGRLDSHDRIAGDNAKKNYAAWRPNSDARNRLLWGGFFRSPCHIILCFRAKDKTEQRDHKILDMGFTPIGGDDFIFEADASILFMPQASGVPTWKSELRGEAKAIKLPGEFRGILDDGRAISWRHGRRLAEWLNAGGAIARTAQGSKPFNASSSAAASPSGTQSRPTDGAAASPPTPAPSPSSTPPPDDFPGDRAAPGAAIAFAGVDYDPARPCVVALTVNIEDMSPRDCQDYGRTLRTLIERAPGYAKRAWYERNTPEMLRLKARSPALHSYVFDALSDSAPPVSGAEGGASGDGSPGGVAGRVAAGSGEF